MIANILTSIKYKNLIWKNFGGILLYLLIAQTVVTKMLPFCKWKSKRKIGQVKKGLAFSIPFCGMISNTIVLYTFCVKFFISLKTSFE